MYIDKELRFEKEIILVTVEVFENVASFWKMLPL